MDTVTQTFIGKVTNPSKFGVALVITVFIIKPDGTFDDAAGLFALGPGESSENLSFTYDTDQLGKYCFIATFQYQVDVNNESTIDITGTGPNSKSGCFARV